MCLDIGFHVNSGRDFHSGHLVKLLILMRPFGDYVRQRTFDRLVDTTVIVDDSNEF